jgi:hypothetical protein
MLAPNVVQVGGDFADAFSDVMSVDRFAFTGMNILVGKLNPDPSWLGPVRTRIGMLSDACAAWQKDKPEIWAGVLQPFLDYYTLFKGFADVSPDFGNNKDLWLQTLTALQAGLDAAAATTAKAEASFTIHINNIKNVESLLNQSLDQGWAELSSEEDEMVALATEMTHLQDQLDQLQSSLTNSEISNGKSYIQSALSISYTIATTMGAEIPYLAILGEVFTIGKMAYDLIVTSQEITDTINKIVDLRVEVSQEAQAAAATKVVIRLIDNLNLSLASAQGRLPRFVEMWQTESGKVAATIQAVQAGVVPENLADLKLNPPLATWKQLADFVPKLTVGPTQGTPVKITTTGSKNPISQGA